MNEAQLYSAGSEAAGRGAEGSNAARRRARGAQSARRLRRARTTGRRSREPPSSRGPTAARRSALSVYSVICAPEVPHAVVSESVRAARGIERRGATGARTSRMRWCALVCLGLIGLARASFADDVDPNQCNSLKVQEHLDLNEVRAGSGGAFDGRQPALNRGSREARGALVGRPLVRDSRRQTVGEPRSCLFCCTGS